MRRVFIRSTAVAALAALSLCVAASASVRSQPRFSPNPGQQNFLSSVQAITAGDAWAVGAYCKAHCATSPLEHTLALRWNGTRWVEVPSPNPAPDDALNSVSGSSPADVWAVGQYAPNHSLPSGLVLRWNGRKLVRARFAAFGTADVVNLSAVSTRSPRDAWIVGYESDPNGGATNAVAAHWNGQAWRAVPVPQPGHPAFLGDVSVVSARDAWAVGDYCASRCGRSGEVRRGMILHWNGRKWAVTRLPVKSSDINDITASSATGVWALGELDAHPISISVILHWNGKRWSSVPSVPGVVPQALAFGARNDGWGVFTDTSIRWNGV